MAEQHAEGAAAPKSKKKTLIIIIVAVLVLALAGVAAVMLMGGKKKDKDKEEGGHAKEAHSLATVAFEEKFTVNLHSDDGTNHFMQVPKMELEVTDGSVAKQIEEKKAKIMDRISSTLRGKSMKEMLEPGSDIKLKEELKTEINKVLEKGKGVEEVILPASFIVQ
jgi:flagellar FliL protein